MRKFKGLLVMTILATILVGCPSSSPPPFDITKDITQEVPVAVTANTNGECLDYTETETFNLRSNSDFNENYDYIQGTRFNSITLEITNYVGDDGVYLNSGSLNFGTASLEIGKIDLKAADTANQTFVFTDATNLAAIGTAITSSGGSITMSLETRSGGNCDNDFSYTLKVTVNVTASIQL
ncbi:MAG: hypothetical protein ACI93N_001021 [Flavobacteriaceae bacterium]|jgi:hypothetical protein